MGALFTSWPFPLAFAVLFLIILARANATYWLGRAARRGADHTRVQQLLTSASYRTAERIVARWGPIAVTACFVTIGLQTLINLVAGATRMPLRRYLPAMIIGGIVWALMYATIGALSLQAWWLLYQRWPVVAIMIIVILGVALSWFIARQLIMKYQPTPREPDAQPCAESGSRAPDRSGSSPR